MCFVHTIGFGYGISPKQKQWFRSYTNNFIILGGGREKKEKRVRKVKKTKLAGQPKRGQSSYFLWMNANRDDIKKENPEFGIGDIAKKAGELWKALSDKSVSIQMPFYIL